MTPDDLPRILWTDAYRLRWKRRRALWRAYQARRNLQPVVNRLSEAGEGPLLFLCCRNEMGRLPFWLAHYRRLGVRHVLAVDNASTDGSAEWLADQPEVSLWQTSASYRASRFGMDWLNWLLTRYGHGRWCLTVDADELLEYPDSNATSLPALTRALDRSGQPAFGALMLDLYPKGRLGQGHAPANPLDMLHWFDAGPYRAQRQSPMGNLWVQGGARERVFFAHTPRQSPTLNKLPLVRWRRGMAYVNSTHALLPRVWNGWYDGPGGRLPSGVLLHTKFLPEIVARSAEERERAQHFHTPAAFGGYYDTIATGPVLWHVNSVRYRDPDQLAALGLLRDLRRTDESTR